ncbi:TonB-dependent receptor [Winogradskyella echinorum]|uniref:TonB-dependent receptor n=1 Tax=Winogradskyella echinorum TaxID=538189 RepID=A0ABR6XY96_9FLAO|nr:TonB-dependent receptor [Winogradskyella echinorum]MBC3845451.1 TonB-dependent receptor [Winogradskyella echinorum]MBC5749799.1 TonB-dependent receptor [Winogradskyella echinorum]
MKTILKLFTMLFCVVSFAQTTVKGKITDNTGLPLPGANIVVVGTTSGTITDFDGNYTLAVDQDPPFSIRISYTGFEPQTVEVTSNNQTIDVSLKEGNTLDEVVISASRTPERIFESPVTVERFGLKEIKNTASADFYGGLESLKGVDINTNSLTFKSINTRGFATFANTRFVQLVDGMDNSAPALNFPLGNLLGMTETDVLSVELLPGASSALYGANAFNGILFMRSKSPFDHSGISGYIKRGITSQEAAGNNDYTDLGIRMAYKFSEKFAAKVNFGYLKGTDWYATNYDDKDMPGGTRESNINYDGVNTYGDNVSTNIHVASGGLGIIPNVSVSRTGYREEDLTDYSAESVKADWGLYFRPWENDFEIQYVGKVGTGSTIYQGAQRYRIDGFSLQQHKIEVKNDDFFVRGYITSDKAGDTYVMDVAAPNILQAWKSHEDWFGDYIQTYAGAVLGGASEAQAHVAARQVAEQGRLEPGTPEFQEVFDQVTSDTNFLTGSAFKDNSKIYHADANYNLGDLVDFAEIQVGGSHRTYRLNSFGTIYTDATGPITYSELGLYTQLQRSLELNENLELKLTGSLRYDKSELFDAFLSPRISAGLTVNENHNFRASFQTGFRNPDTQSLYIGLETALGTLIGGAPDNGDRYVRDYGVSPFAQNNLGVPSTISQAASAAYNNSLFASIGTGLSNHSGGNGSNYIANSDYVKPEQVSSFELGYRGKIQDFIIDASAYYSSYQDFLAGEGVIAPFYGDVSNFDLTGYDPNNPATVAGLNSDTQQILAALQNGDFQAYQTNTNSSEKVNSYGAAIQVSTKVFDGFDLSANYTYAKLDFDVKKNPDFRTNFNTPEHKVKASFGKTDLFKNVGFNVSWRWSDNYFWEASFGDGDVPAFHVLDAQVNFRIPGLKSAFKVGATNLLQDEYFTAFGTGYIGSQYYVSWTINNL